MERVKKGEKYWYVASVFFAEDFYITYGVDFYEDIQDGRFANRNQGLCTVGNYFHTKEEAEAMAKKLRAVLKGADVIEMPSEEEIREYTDNYIRYPVMRVGFRKAIDWLKSKIVK